MALRDGSPSDPDDPRNRRYVEGQRLYFATCDPARRADLVIDHNRCAASERLNVANAVNTGARRVISTRS